MLSVLMLSLLIPVTGVPDIPMTAFSQQDDPPVKLWLSKDHVQLGDRVQVDVRTESDGYLLVLHAEPDGRVRVLSDIVKRRSFRANGHGVRAIARLFDSHDGFAHAPTSLFVWVFPHPSEGVGRVFQSVKLDRLTVGAILK